MQVIVTRPAREAEHWVQALRSAGLGAVAYPMIEISPLADQTALHERWRHLEQYQAVMFVSPNAVNGFFAAQPVVGAQAFLARAFATGPGSRDALVQQGVPITLIDAPSAQSGQFDSESLWSLVSEQVTPGFQLLVVRGTTADSLQYTSSHGQGRDWFSKQVLERGGLVDKVASYVRGTPVLTDSDRARILRLTGEGAVWLFSSSEAINNAVALLPDVLWSAACAVVTHPRIGEAARAAGFGNVVQSRPLLSDVLTSIESLQ